MTSQTLGQSPEIEQLELIQRLGRIGYWEYEPAAHKFWLPAPSLQLLSSMTGSSREAAPNLRDVMSEAERKRFLVALEQAVSGQLPLHLELQLASYRGQHATIVVKGTPLEGKGHAIRFGGTFHDITREKRVEAEREEVLSQLNALLGGLPVGVTVFDEDLRLIFWNDHIYDILGLPQGAVYKYVRFEDLIRYPADRGEYGPGDPAELVAQRAVLARKFEAHRFERAARDGRTLLVDGYPFRFGGKVSGFVTTYTDITDRKQTEEQLKRQNGVLNTIIENFPGAISLFDASLHMVACNQQFKTLLELPDSLFDKEVVYFEDFIRYNAYRGEYGPGDPEEQIAGALERARNFQAHNVERVRPNGKALEIRGTPLPGGGFVSIYIDITERKRAEERIRSMALEDSLTGLPNRLSLNDQIEQALERFRSNSQHFSLLFLDLDGFKKVNDSLGHDAGDELLVQVARRLKECVRETDSVARLGGDEFVVLLRDVEGAAIPEKIAGEIIARLAEPFSLQAAEARIGTSIGISLCPEHGDNREALLKAADQSMYAAKSAGRGTWRMAGTAD
ncbi:MAG: PAS-domain containing protein [Rhodocyclaceae bacterium]